MVLQQKSNISDDLKCHCYSSQAKLYNIANLEICVFNQLK